jgi:hypothetical protein
MMSTVATGGWCGDWQSDLEFVQPDENLAWLCVAANNDILLVLVEGIAASLWCRALFRSKVSG